MKSQDPPAVRIQQRAIVPDLNAAGHAVVTFVVSRAGTDSAAVMLLFSVNPANAEVLSCVRLRDGVQAEIPLRYAPGICLDLASSMCARTFPRADDRIRA